MKISRNLGKKLSESRKLAGIWKKIAGFWKKWPESEKKWPDSRKSGRNLGKRSESGKNGRILMERRAGRVSRVLEEEIRHSTRWCRVFEVGTRVRPPEPSDQVIPGWFWVGVAGWTGGRFVWTALLAIHPLCLFAPSHK